MAYDLAVDSSLIVRPARVQDVKQMARVHVRCWQETYRGLMPDAVLDDPGFPAARERMWTGALTGERYRQNRVAVAERDGELVGIAMSGPPEDVSMPAMPGPVPFPNPSASVPAATMFLMAGLPGAGKTTRAEELAAVHRALRLTPDHWMIPLFGDSMADGKRFVLEGRLFSVYLQALRLGTSVVLD
ncbi:MAG: AAA family ATPase, partial [Streptosporangiaceae bacterium]